MHVYVHVYNYVHVYVCLYMCSHLYYGNVHVCTGEISAAWLTGPDTKNQTVQPVIWFSEKLSPQVSPHIRDENNFQIAT